WPFGTKQRAAYELMLNVRTARVDTHLTTWVQAAANDVEYTRRKTGVPVVVEKALSLRAALAALTRKHVCILTTEWGKINDLKSRVISFASRRSRSVGRS